MAVAHKQYYVKPIPMFSPLQMELQISCDIRTKKEKGRTIR